MDGCETTHRKTLGTTAHVSGLEKVTGLGRRTRARISRVDKITVVGIRTYIHTCIVFVVVVAVVVVVVVVVVVTIAV